MTFLMAAAGATLAYYLFIRKQGLQVRDTLPPFVLLIAFLAFMSL